MPRVVDLGPRLLREWTREMRIFFEKNLCVLKSVRGGCYEEVSMHSYYSTPTYNMIF